MRCVAPNLDVPNIDETVAFYRDVFGFSEVLRIPDVDGRAHYAVVRNGAATVMFDRIDHLPQEKRPYVGTGVTLYIDVGEGDLEALYQNLTCRGLLVVKPLQDEYWGARSFTVEDINGYHVTFAQQVSELTPEQMASNLRRQV